MKPSALAHLLRVISTERRVRILQMLLESDDPVSQQLICQITEFGEGQVSHNLAQLAEVGIVLRQQHGKMVFWSPNRGLVREVFGMFEKGKE